jgi:uncharacterized membrane protein YbhN (UPF0104 family)
MNSNVLQGSAESGPPPRPSLARRLAGPVIAVVLLAFFVRGIDWPELLKAFKTARPELLLACCLVTVLMYLIRAWRWRSLLLPLATIPVPPLFTITIVGFTAGFAIPRAQEFLRPYLVGQRYGISPFAAFASIILERLLDLMALLLLFGVSAYFFPPHLPGEEGARLLRNLQWSGALGGLASFGGALALMLFHRHAELGFRILGFVLRPLPVRMSGFVVEKVRAFVEGLAVLRAPLSHLALVALQSLLLWLAIDLTVFLNNKAFGLDLSLPSSFLIVAILLIGVMIPTPGMVGGYHIAYRNALTMIYGIPTSIAVAAGFTGYAVTQLPVLLLGLVFLRTEGLTLARVREVAQSGAEGTDVSGPPRAGADPGPPQLKERPE